MNKKVLYPLLVLALGLAAAVLIAINQPEVEPEAYERLLSTVRVMRVEARTEHLEITSQGTV
ncbi:MAG: hypothetical protein KDI21_13230, partial [Halieaceae bacterium]|nr:hypothetical protein [Halieaceae bacterium]